MKLLAAVAAALLAIASPGLAGAQRVPPQGAARHEIVEVIAPIPPSLPPQYIVGEEGIASGFAFGAMAEVARLRVRYVAAAARGGERIKAVGRPLKEIKRARAVRKGTGAFLARLDRAAGVFENPPRHREIYAKWHGRPAAHWTPRRVALAAGTAAAVVALFLAFWRHRSLVRLNRRLAESVREKERAERQVRLLLDSTGEAIYGVDLDGRCTFANPACARLLGYGAPPELLGRDMHALIHHTRPDGSRYPAEECSVCRASRGGEAVAAGDEVFWRADGTSFPAEYRVSPIRRDGGISGAVVSFTDLTRRREAERALRQSEASLANAQRIARTVSAALEPERLFASVVSEIRGVVACDRCVIGTIDPEREISRYWHVDSDVRLRERTVDEERSARAWIAENLYATGRSTRLDSLGRMDVPWMRRLAEDGLKGLLLVPIPQGDQSVAHIALASRREGAFSRETERLVESIAGHLGPLIRNANLYRTAEKRAATMRTLYEVGREISRKQALHGILDRVTAAAADLFACDMASLFLWEEGKRAFVMESAHGLDQAPPGSIALKWEETLAERFKDRPHGLRVSETKDEPVLHAGNPFLRKSGIRSLISVPLNSGDELVGWLNCLSRRPNFFSEEDLHLLGSFGSQVSVAIENARLDEEESRSRNFLESIVGDSGDAIVVSEAEELQVVLWNKAAERIFGYRTDEMKGAPITRLVPEEELAATLAHTRKARASLRSQTFESFRIRRDEGRVPVSITLSPVRDAAGGVVAISAIYKDLTEHRRAEEEIRRLNESLEAKVEERTAQLAEKTAQIARLNEINRDISSLLDPEEVMERFPRDAVALLGGRCSQLFLLDPEGAVLRLEEGYCDEGRPFPPGFTLSLDGSLSGFVARTGRPAVVGDVWKDPRWAGIVGPERKAVRAYIGVPFHVRGKVAGVMTVFSDERGKFRADDVPLLEALSAQVSVAWQNARAFQGLNEKTAEIEKLIEVNRDLSSLLPLREVLEKIVETTQEILPAVRTNFYLYDEASDQLTVTVGIIASAMGDPDRIFHVRGREGLVGAAANARQPVYADDVRGDPRWVGRQWTKRYAIRAFAAVPLIAGDALYGVLTCFREEERAWTGEEKDLLESFAAQAAVAIHNARLLDDVTEYNRRLEATLEELQVTQAQLVQSEKMASLGSLVAGIAHEINTPVGVGVTAASYLEDRVSELGERYHAGRIKRSHLERFIETGAQSARIIHENLRRASELIGSFKQVAVDQSNERRRAFALGPYLDEVVVSLGPALKKTPHRIRVVCDEGLTLDSFPGAISQIVTNLVMNSLAHAFGEGQAGGIVIEARRRGGGVRLRYADDGRGIPPGHLEKIFEPFFTTRRGAGGSGLGLHIIYNIVTRTLGGTIACRSEPGAGAEFLIDLPA